MVYLEHCLLCVVLIRELMCPQPQLSYPCIVHKCVVVYF